ncbi:hypothetical protein [Porphyrobacter sp. ULC335]|uniref:hypothetical protein n=1 Tax=Porphyrobacter sp. ULC335 TaxID=2854260 RepID=UPI002220B0A0|nr:hypothetical protein [Porphyrobacter sp. ULC335]UYV14551.1 hypothetical protein KVF90_10295 [Porphyrobacter sp. ULC335]
MKPLRRLTPKCLFWAWVLGWATAVYLPSLAIALLSLSPLAAGENLLVDTFQVADEVSPAAKLAYAILFGGCMFAIRMAGANRRLFVDALGGAASIMLVAAFLPEYWSRGFGIGLNGIRFETVPTTIYVIGGLLSGIVFSLVEARCVLRSQKHAGDEAAQD